jgi:hypothetical protein
VGKYLGNISCSQVLENPLGANRTKSSLEKKPKKLAKNEALLIVCHMLSSFVGGIAL